MEQGLKFFVVILGQTTRQNLKNKIHTPCCEFINKGKYYTISRSQFQLYNYISSYLKTSEKWCLIVAGNMAETRSN